VRVFMYGTEDQPLEDTPEVRKWLETLAIPKCAIWRAENPIELDHVYVASCLLPDALDHRHIVAAPYCPSAYCGRCAGHRELDGADEVIPNAWLYEAPEASLGIIEADRMAALARIGAVAFPGSLVDNLRFYQAGTIYATGGNQ